MTEKITADELALSRRTIVLDFDGTLCPLGELGPEGEFSLEGIEPKPGALNALRRLHLAGYRIVVASSRNWSGYGLRRFTFLEEMCAWLRKHGMRDLVEIDMGDQGKIPGACYIDDRGIRFNDDWPAVADWLCFSREGE